jgi:hypothetical protein
VTRCCFGKIIRPLALLKGLDKPGTAMNGIERMKGMTGTHSFHSFDSFHRPFQLFNRACILRGE